ncbi:MAG: glucose 1-dehydrogenase [Actinobacteria bacterium]|nr:glucose 1-dehydrogenase [Actinomycetota bacterium]
MGALSGTNCLVTGAAGGIGAAICRRLVEQGASVVLVDIGREPVADLARELGRQAVDAVADVTDEGQMQSAVDLCVERFGSLDVIFNNAGISKLTPLEAIDRDVFDRLMGVNVYGVLVGSKVAARQMAAQGKGGKIINTCSVAGKQGAPVSSVYVATKFAVRGITQSLAKELADRSIRVNAFCPGIVDTPLWKPIGEQGVAAGVFAAEDDLPRMLAEQATLGRGSVPEDVVGLAAFLASTDADYITGQCINVDGGIAFD